MNTLLCTLLAALVSGHQASFTTELNLSSYAESRIELDNFACSGDFKAYFVLPSLDDLPSVCPASQYNGLALVAHYPTKKTKDLLNHILNTELLPYLPQDYQNVDFGRVGAALKKDLQKCINFLSEDEHNYLEGSARLKECMEVVIQDSEISQELPNNTHACFTDLRKLDLSSIFSMYTEGIHSCQPLLNRQTMVQLNDDFAQCFNRQVQETFAAIKQGVPECVRYFKTEFPLEDQLKLQTTIASLISDRWLLNSIEEGIHGSPDAILGNKYAVIAGSNTAEADVSFLFIPPKVAPKKEFNISAFAMGICNQDQFIYHFKISVTNDE